MIIGITGPMCAGKGETSKILAGEYGFSPISFGDEVRLEARALEIPKTREMLQWLGAHYKQIYGKDIWSKKIIAKMDSSTKYVVDGFRCPEEIEPFKIYNPFALIGVTADFDLRCDRYIARARPGDTATRESFTAADAVDRGEKGLLGSESALVYQLKEYEIVNNTNNFRDLNHHVADFIVWLASHRNA